MDKNVNFRKEISELKFYNSIGTNISHSKPPLSTIETLASFQNQKLLNFTKASDPEYKGLTPIIFPATAVSIYKAVEEMRKRAFNRLPTESLNFVKYTSNTILVNSIQ